MLATKLGVQKAREMRTTKAAWGSPRAAEAQASSPQTKVEEMAVYYNDGVYEAPRRPRRSDDEGSFSRRIIDEVYDFKGEYANPRYRDIELPLGLKWVEAGPDKQGAGMELNNPALAAALQSRLDRADKLDWSGADSALVFTRAEWDDLNVPPLRRKNFIRVGNKFYRPFAVKKKAKANAQEGRAGQISLLLSAFILLVCGSVIAVYALTTQPLVDHTLASACTSIDFQCLDSDRDGCLTATEFNATRCRGNCTNSSLPSFVQIAGTSSSDGECDGGKDTDASAIVVSPSDYSATPEVHGRSNRTLRCEREVLRQAGCRCPTKDAKDCDCANTDVEWLRNVWESARIQLWALGFSGAAICTGIPALISGIRHMPCINTGCYRTCAGLCSAVFLVVAALFLGVGMIIDRSANRWNRNFGVESCQPMRGPRVTTALGGEVDIVACSKGGYCILLDTVGVELSGRMTVIGATYLVAGITMSFGCVFCCAFEKSVPQPSEPEEDEEADEAPPSKGVTKTARPSPA